MSLLAELATVVGCVSPDFAGSVLVALAVAGVAGAAEVDVFACDVVDPDDAEEIGVVVEGEALDAAGAAAGVVGVGVLAAAGVGAAGVGATTVVETTGFGCVAASTATSVLRSACTAAVSLASVTA